MWCPNHDLFRLARCCALTATPAPTRFGLGCQTADVMPVMQPAASRWPPFHVKLGRHHSSRSPGAGVGVFGKASRPASSCRGASRRFFSLCAISVSARGGGSAWSTVWSMQMRGGMQSRGRMRAVLPPAARTRRSRRPTGPLSRSLPPSIHPSVCPSVRVPPSLTRIAFSCLCIVRCSSESSVLLAPFTQRSSAVPGGGIGCYIDRVL